MPVPAAPTCSGVIHGSAFPRAQGVVQSWGHFQLCSILGRGRMDGVTAVTGQRMLPSITDFSEFMKAISDTVFGGD